MKNLQKLCLIFTVFFFIVCCNTKGNKINEEKLIQSCFNICDEKNCIFLNYIPSPQDFYSNKIQKDQKQNIVVSTVFWNEDVEDVKNNLFLDLDIISLEKSESRVLNFEVFDNINDGRKYYFINPDTLLNVVAYKMQLEKTRKTGILFLLQPILFHSKNNKTYIVSGFKLDTSKAYFLFEVINNEYKFLKTLNKLK